MKKYILAIDQGTTGTTAALIDQSDFSMVGKITQEFSQIYPQPSWVEHDLNDIWDSVQSTVTEVLKKNNISGNQIICIGITNQRETTCAFNKHGRPLANAIVWQDRRTSEMCEKIKKNNNDYFIKMTGLPVDPYFSATKMKWLLENNQQVRDAAKNNDLKLGTIDTFLLYRLTNCQSFKTEASNASRTLLMNLQTSNWDPDLLKKFGISLDLLPEICDSFTLFGETKMLSFLPDGIPITGILGDQQAALFGQAGNSKDSIKCTYGTGAFLLLNTGKTITYSKSQLLTTVAYKYIGETYYALEGSSYIAGAAVSWLRDNLNLIVSSSDVESLANNVTNLSELEHLTFLPFFSGIASPYWKPDAKGAIIGITRDTNKSHIAHACLEGICFAINDLIKAMREDCHSKLVDIRVDGGACENNLLLQIQSSISDINIIRPKVIETTAYGAALGAAIGKKVLSFEQLQKFWKIDKTISPNQNKTHYYQKKQLLWDNLIKKLYL